MDFSHITTLVFDFGGVLINLDKDACVRQFKQLGVQDIDSMLSNYVQAGIFMQLEKGELSADAFRDEVRRLCHVNLTNQQIDFALNAFLLDIPREKLELLLRLRKHFRVVMLSNTNIIHFEYCRQHHFAVDGHQLHDFFDHCYLSYEMHLAKPDCTIFEQMLRAEGVQPKKCFYLDDSAQNIETAARLGFSTYLVHEHEDLRPLFGNVPS